MYALCFGRCAQCGRSFSFNLDHVPSVHIDGARKPVCRDCIDEANARWAAAGEETFPVHPDAYEPGPAERFFA